mmetsp:Transcript_75578/g.219513  ORF Transcript_75578/g.219513 Transcript_75578/m.219513 type:complete len:402 (-) Transcript_75578:85-1290(-)
MASERGPPLLLDHDLTSSSSAEEEGAAARGYWSARKVSWISGLGVLAVIGAVAVLAQPHGPRLSRVAASPRLATLRAMRDEAPEHGVVDAIYTFGAPASASPRLVNLATSDRCFPGLRSYTEDVLGPKTKQVDAGAIANAYEHAQMAVVALRPVGSDSAFEPCPGKSDWPTDKAGDEFMEWRLHWENDYTPRLQAVMMDGSPLNKTKPFTGAQRFVLFAYKAYDITAHVRQNVKSRSPTWKLVARETSIEGSGPTYDEDPVMILQDSESLDCAVVFAGTNNLDNEVTTSLETYGTDYCGFHGVHAGYRNELWRITEHLMPRLRPKLEKCNKVTCVGHSMGGSLCEIFAACANSGRTKDADFQQQAWTRGQPAMLPEISKGGVVFAEGAERRCEEPPCPKTR